jgi:transcription initiation factor IIE alpha subunit
MCSNSLESFNNMTRTYALKRLLEHGELSSKQIEEITCWTTKQVWASIQRLQKTEIIRKYPKMKWGLIDLNPYPYDAQSS